MDIASSFSAAAGEVSVDAAQHNFSCPPAPCRRSVFTMLSAQTAPSATPVPGELSSTAFAQRIDGPLGIFATNENAATLGTFPNPITAGHARRQSCPAVQISCPAPAPALPAKLAMTPGAAQLQLESTEHREFMVALDKTKGASLGIDVDHRLSGSLLICNIFGGCVQGWNREHPDLAVKVGDHIVAVNGVSGHPCGLMTECWKNQVHMVRIRREAPAPGSPSLAASLACNSTIETAASCAGSASAPPARRAAGKVSAARGTGGRGNLVCCHWRQAGLCHHGDACRYAHPADKKGPSPAALVAPAALAAPAAPAAPAARSVCRHWRQKGWCQFQDACHFAHPEHLRGGAAGK